MRMALGAPRGEVLALVIREGLALVTIGLVLGLAGALAMTRVLGATIFEQQSSAGLTLLVDTQPTDLLTYVAVVAVLVSVAIRRLPRSGPPPRHRSIRWWRSAPSSSGKRLAFA